MNWHEHVELTLGGPRFLVPLPALSSIGGQFSTARAAYRRDIHAGHIRVAPGDTVQLAFLDEPSAEVECAPAGMAYCNCGEEVEAATSNHARLARWLVRNDAKLAARLRRGFAAAYTPWVPSLSGRFGCQPGGRPYLPAADADPAESLIRIAEVNLHEDEWLIGVLLDYVLSPSAGLGLRIESGELGEVGPDDLAFIW